jgi:hypothetical protein
MKTNNFPT